MALAACLAARKTLRTFVRSVFMNSPLSISVKSFGCPMIPALANMMSSLPYVATASSTTPLMSVSLAASRWRAWMSTAG